MVRDETGMGVGGRLDSTPRPLRVTVFLAFVSSSITPGSPKDRPLYSTPKMVFLARTLVSPNIVKSLVLETLFAALLNLEIWRLNG